MNKLICKIFGHKWLYNFVSMPNKAICSRCRNKAIVNRTPENILDWYWEKVDSFPNEKRTDEELMLKWVN